MSASNRGAVRATNDFYATPQWLTRAVIPFLPQRPATILEPACGSGAIICVLKECFSDARIDCFDIDPKHGAPVADFLREQARQEYDLVITNPPFGDALRFIQRALEWRRDSTSVVCMLLRLNFLEGQERARWLRANMPSGLLITPRRPSFTGKGTDATGYGWFVWDDQPTRIVLLETEDGAGTLSLFGK